MNFNYSDFIYEDFCDDSYNNFFDDLIKKFDDLIEQKKSFHRNLSFVEDENAFIFDNAHQKIVKIIKPHLEKYAELVKYNQNMFIPNECKIQKSVPRQGYHGWHQERCSDKNETAMSIREFVWILYLNDVEEGGETEFLLQSRRIIPKKGKICIWPSSFTHLHRGNPPIKGEKYIITSWTFTSNFISMN
jgi:hypothetical protein